MRVAIMQPYFLPYIGYFHLMKSVDKFVVYDNIQFTKKGWINRNRILVDGKDDLISLPLKKDSDFLNINQRYLADSFDPDKIKLKRKIHASYSKAPYYKETASVIEDIIDCKEDNLFNYIFNSIHIINRYLNINTELIKSSTLNFDIQEYKGQNKVLQICKNLAATTYINPIGGTELYSKEDFNRANIDLFFIKSKECVYSQYKNDFVPWLSIIDVLMFNSVEKVNAMVEDFDLQ